MLLAYRTDECGRTQVVDKQVKTAHADRLTGDFVITVNVLKF